MGYASLMLTITGTSLYRENDLTYLLPPVKAYFASLGSRASTQGDGTLLLTGTRFCFTRKQFKLEVLAPSPHFARSAFPS
jgi:hypothetical protein